MATNGDLILYQSGEDGPKIQVTVKDDDVWLNQYQMSDLFQAERSVITKHIDNILSSGELDREATCAKFAQVRSEGNRTVTREIDHYNLDMIISVGYRVNSHRGVQFRVWATKTLREYIVKGFVIDDDRLSGKQGNYFDELLERVRRIRTSEINFYEKVKAIFGTSIDYQGNSPLAINFYATVQNKFHFATHGKTAAELVVSRADAFKPKMGLVHTKGQQPTKAEAYVAKNYLNENELKSLELLVDQFLSFAELQSHEKRPMYMKDWQEKLDGFIRLNDKKVLDSPGKVSRKQMEARVDQEYGRFKEAQHEIAPSDVKLLHKGKTARPKRTRITGTPPTEIDDD